MIVSARLSLRPDIPLLSDPDSRVVIYTASDDELDGCGAKVEYVRPDAAPATADDLQERAARLPLAPLMRALRTRYGVGTVLCEGGPALNAGLLHEDLVDELYLALAPKLVAGVGPAVVDGPPIDPPAEMRLVSVMESGGHLFMRYRISA